MGLFHLALLSFQGVTSDRIENEQSNGKKDYIQTLKYFGDPKHNGHKLTCVVSHMAYSEAQLAAEENKISMELELLCKLLRAFLSLQRGLLRHHSNHSSQAPVQTQGPDILQAEGGRGEGGHHQVRGESRAHGGILDAGRSRAAGRARSCQS